MDWILNPDIWLSLLTLTALEVVLGIDNLVFIAVLVEKLPPEQRPLARRLGIGAALLSRLLLLATLSWIIGLTAPIFELLGQPVSWRDLILIAGGFFLLYKATHEIHDSLEGDEGSASARVRASFASVVTQIAILDIVFSLDSVITAVGMANEIWVMVTAIVIAVVIMLAAAAPVSGFVRRHPTVKMLALAFLLLIGTTLIADGFGVHVPKGYIYTAMGFSVFVEVLNMLYRRRAKPLHLRQAYAEETADKGAPPSK
jgi:predicted tellurium resistance membrane protein TerC